MIRQFLILSLVLSMMFITTSGDKICFTQCMACLMIDDTYCLMDVAYPSGAQHCLGSCGTKECSLPGESVYGIINALRECRERGGNTHACVFKIVE